MRRGLGPWYGLAVLADFLLHDLHRAPAPVVPVSQWGAQDLLDTHRSGRWSLRLDAITAELEVLRGERAPAQRREHRPSEQRRTA